MICPSLSTITPDPEPGALGSRSRGPADRVVDAGNTFTTEGFTCSARSVITDSRSSSIRMPGESTAAPTGSLRPIRKRVDKAKERKKVLQRMTTSVMTVTTSLLFYERRLVDRQPLFHQVWGVRSRPRQRAGLPVAVQEESGYPRSEPASFHLAREVPVRARPRRLASLEASLVVRPIFQ